MATDQKIVDFILDQIADLGDVSARKMFGEYGLFHDGKMVAIIGDNELFLKATAAGRALIGEVDEQSPYPGAKPCFLIPAEKWDDREWMTSLIKLSSAELPMPAPKKPKILK